jgi:hypothetical protein
MVGEGDGPHHRRLSHQGLPLSTAKEYAMVTRFQLPVPMPLGPVSQILWYRGDIIIVRLNDRGTQECDHNM